MMSSGEWGKAKMLVVLFILLQLVSTVLLWSLNPVGSKEESDFALLLAADLVAFSAVSYMSRKGNRGEPVHGGFILAGSAVALFFMLLVLIT